MSGPSYHGPQTHDRGGTDALTSFDIAVTDGGTTVDPVTELDIGAGLVLTNPSAGIAALATVGRFAFAITSALITPGTTYTGPGASGYTYQADFSDAVITGTSGLLTVSGSDLLLNEAGWFLVLWGPRLSDNAALRAILSYSGPSAAETLVSLGCQNQGVDDLSADRLGALTVAVIHAVNPSTISGLYVCPGNTGTAPTVYDGAVFVKRIDI